MRKNKEGGSGAVLRCRYPSAAARIFLGTVALTGTFISQKCFCSCHDARLQQNHPLPLRHVESGRRFVGSDSKNQMSYNAFRIASTFSNGGGGEKEDCNDDLAESCTTILANNSDKKLTRQYYKNSLSSDQEKKIQEDDAKYVIDDNTDDIIFPVSKYILLSSVKNTKKKIGRVVGGVFSVVGFISSATRAVFFDREHFNQRLKTTLKEFVKYLKTSGIMAEVSKSISGHLVTNLIILSRIQGNATSLEQRRKLVEDRKRRRLPFFDEALRCVRQMT